MIRRRNLRTRSIKLLILDEADEMLTKGFKEQLYDIYRYLPPGAQVVLLSATLPHEVLEMTSKFMTDPVRVLVKRYIYKYFNFSLVLGCNKNMFVWGYEVFLFIYILNCTYKIIKNRFCDSNFIFC